VSDKVVVTVFVELMFVPARQLDDLVASFHFRVAEGALASLLVQFRVDGLPKPALDTLNNRFAHVSRGGLVGAHGLRSNKG